MTNSYKVTYIQCDRCGDLKRQATLQNKKPEIYMIDTDDGIKDICRLCLESDEDLS